MASRESYSDNELAGAVASSDSWRGVLRALGLRATSGSAIASVRRRAEQAGCPTDHLGAPRARQTGGEPAVSPEAGGGVHVGGKTGGGPPSPCASPVGAEGRSEALRSAGRQDESFEL